MSQEDYRKIVQKGRRWLMEYLLDMGKGSFSDADSMKNLFRIIGDEYKSLMYKDEAFFREVEEFCSKRRFLSEKQVFCRKIMNQMVSSGNVHRRYAEKNPDFNIPEKYKRQS